MGLREQPPGRLPAAPGSQLQPLSRMAQGQASAGHQLLAHSGSPGGETEAGNGSRSLRRLLDQPMTSPVTVDPGSEGILAPKEAGTWRGGPADWAERRAGRNDRPGAGRPCLSPSALEQCGQARGNMELLRAPCLSHPPWYTAWHPTVTSQTPGRDTTAPRQAFGGRQILVPPTPRRPGATLPRTAGLAACIGAPRCPTQGAPLRPRPPSSTSKPFCWPPSAGFPLPSAALPAP